MESNTLFMVAGAFGVLITLCYVHAKGATRSNPGQEATRTLRKLPLIGDLHSSPIEKPLVNWDAWTQANGPIAVPRLFGLIPIVVLNSAAAVTELFSRRSQWYSNRPASVSMEMITDAAPGQSKFTLMHDYDDHLKLHHRLLTPSLGAPAAPRFQALIELEATQLLWDLVRLSRPSEGIVSTDLLYPQLERTQSSIILGLHYGLRIARFEDEILHQVIDTQSQVTHLAANPLLPDMIPLLRHLPSVLSPWKRAAEKLYAQQVDLYMRLFQHGRETDGWNATKQALSTAEKHARGTVSDLDLAFTLATSIQGGMETSPRQLLWLFIAALHTPSFVTKAHALLDETVGRHRLPRFSDRARLAFIDAITHELFRWRPIAPGSIPRRADQDDEYGGVKIKKGWTLMANAWAIGRDEQVFDPTLGDVQDFVPERWLRPSPPGEDKMQTDLPLPVFGQGRRVCQGKRVATDGAFMQVACLLWAFDIQPVEKGEVVDPWAMVVEGFMTSPRNVRFKLQPRGDWVVEVIAREWAAAGKSPEQVMGVSTDVEI